MSGTVTLALNTANFQKVSYSKFYYEIGNPVSELYYFVCNEKKLFSRYTVVLHLYGYSNSLKCIVLKPKNLRLHNVEPHKTLFVVN